MDRRSFLYLLPSSRALILNNPLLLRHPFVPILDEALPLWLWNLLKDTRLEDDLASFRRRICLRLDRTVNGKQSEKSFKL